jgi:glyoxylase-like metal-dependent hydrolase (beta-lactamase superfamily II)
VKAVAMASVVDRMPSQFEPAMIDDVFRRAFPGQIPDGPGIAERLEDDSFELEGHPLIPIETGYTDTAGSTSLHVPTLGLIVAGDVVYNGIHPYLAETTTQTRRDWIAALDQLPTLNPALPSPGTRPQQRRRPARHRRDPRLPARPATTCATSTASPRRAAPHGPCSTRRSSSTRTAPTPGSLWGGAKAAIAAHERLGPRRPADQTPGGSASS